MGGTPPPCAGTRNGHFIGEFTPSGRRRRPDAGALAAEGGPKFLSFQKGRRGPVGSREGAKNALFCPAGPIFWFFGPDPDPTRTRSKFRSGDPLVFKAGGVPAGGHAHGRAGRLAHGGTPPCAGTLEFKNTLIYIYRYSLLPPT